MAKERVYSKRLPPGIYYGDGFVSSQDSVDIKEWLKRLFPIWEMRYAKNHPPPPTDVQRRLLRPVYWLGNWQFACLGYFHPPKGSLHRCVRAEPYPSVLQRLVNQTEQLTRKMFGPTDIPRGWRLNTCLVNLYGDVFHHGKRQDMARVGEHKDFELGPVASISLGEKALFQFVESGGRQFRSRVVQQMWLEDRSLQIFGGKRWKEQCFHRVQRVDRRQKIKFQLNVEGFDTRRVNFTFRYVPEEYVVPFRGLPKTSQEDIDPYINELAEHSAFFRSQLG